MPDPREKDHWRELAELLGLPPDKDRSAPTPAPAAPPAEAYREVQKTEPVHEEWIQPEAEPVAEASFEPAGYEQRETEFQSFESSRPSEPESTYSETTTSESPDVGPPEPGPDAADEPSQDRPRRGRRRGRRGQRRDGPERDEVSRPELAQRPGKTDEPLEETLGADKAEAVDAETPEEERGGSGGRDRRHKLGESRRSHDEEEEPLETEDADFSEPAHEEEDDDEEIDKLTDWNVPSWTELIGSLYRPER